jgi:SNF2 family DNA or RNA helicase
MVRNTDDEIRNSIVKRLSKVFRRKKVVNFPLEFATSADGKGNFLTRTFMIIKDEKIPVTNVKELWSYGFHFEKSDIRYVLDKESLMTLLSIRSMNPEITEDGLMISPIHPSILKYLRKRERVSEDATSKSVEIQEKPLKPAVEISFVPEKGLRIKAGYAVPGLRGIVRLTDLEKSPEKEYVKLGDTFYLRPEEDAQTRELIETEKDRIIELDKIPEFFKRDLVLLKTNFTAILTEDAAKITINDGKAQPWIRVKPDERGWLDFNITYKVGEDEIPYDLFTRSKSNYVQKDDHTWIRVDHSLTKETEKQLEALGVIKTKTGFRIELTQFQSLEDFIDHIGGTKQVSAEYQQFLNEISDFKQNPTFELPVTYERDLSSNKIILRPYQRAGIHWLDWLTTHHLHGILADDMGLGKTIQTIMAMRLGYDATPNKSHSLIVCPKSVVGHWSREIKRGYPSIDICEYVGSFRDKYAFESKDPMVFITTYETLASDIDILEGVPFLFAVLDEGTKIKNPDTKRAIAVKRLNAAHRLVITGTPIENRPAELWSLFDFLMKRHLGSYGGFVNKYENRIQNGDDQAAQILARRIKPFILRRLKADVAEDLPEKIEMKDWCELTDEQKSLYGQLQDLYVNPLRKAIQNGEQINFATNILPVITKLKQVCDHPALITKKTNPLMGRSEKFDLIIEKLEEINENKEGAVLFSHFLGALNLFETYLTEKRVEYIRIDGSTQNRQQLIDRFNAGDASIALCSLMAGGHGINLTAASHVFHIDRWWNPAIENQATDRVHRIGQTKTVYVYKILVKGTLEEKIDEILERKKGISDKVIGAATRDVTGWTREELLEILEPIREP